MRIINLTPHEIKIHGEDRIVCVMPSGQVARVEEKVTAGCWFCGDSGIPTVEKQAGPVENLPAQKQGQYYIVSAMVLAHCQGRKDVFAPDTGPGSVIRDDAGNVKGVRRLVCAPRSIS